MESRSLFRESLFDLVLHLTRKNEFRRRDFFSRFISSLSVRVFVFRSIKYVAQAFLKRKTISFLLFRKKARLLPLKKLRWVSQKKGKALRHAYASPASEASPAAKTASPTASPMASPA